MIEIENLSLAVGGRSVASVPAFQLPAGAAALLVGPSGSGKTTLLYAVAGLIAPAGGVVRVDGQDVFALPQAARDRFRGRRIGIVFQTLLLIRSLTVAENLALAMRLAGKPKDPARIAATLERLGLARLANRLPARLSVGESQRAAVARAIIGEPKLILADEPTSALDDANAARTLDLLAQEAESLGAALLIATHDARARARFPVALELAGQA